MVKLDNRNSSKLYVKECELTKMEEPITNDHIDDDASIHSNDEPYQSSSSVYVPFSYSSSHEGDEDDYANLRKELILANSTFCDEPLTKILSNLPVSPLDLACQLQEVSKSMKYPVFPLQICYKFQITDNSSDSEIEITAYEEKTNEKENTSYSKNNKITILSNVVLKEPITNDHIDDDASIQSNNEPYQSSSSEYVPSSYSSSHEGDEDDYANLRKELILANSTLCDEPSTKMLSNLPVSPFELACQLQEVPKSMKSPVFPLQICDKFQIPDNSSDSKIETTAYVNRAKRTISVSRVYDKRHTCYFCDKLIGTVTRHLELVHLKKLKLRNY
ncbi:hypothetical protein RN001_002032 [Aquatica leii]|uniref:Uncharacterized protein n=1 Tax=Aquatica leii TaxID=1421715 RepID=A0AAN7PLV7_9COLE|nr:hypothetical protein RN001_002032 [Aquatica leii]